MYTDRKNKNWYKIGLHIHTTLSDGALSPEDAAKCYKAEGFDAIAITDHWNFYPEGELAGLKIFSGCEYNIATTDDTSIGVMHIVGIGMKNAPHIPDGVAASRQEVIDKIKAEGGMAVLAHPAWSLNTPDDVKKLNGFDMLEIYNAASDTEQSARPYSGYIIDILANEGISFPLTATDDAHHYAGLDNCKAYIVANLEELSFEALEKAIHSKNFYASQGPELYVKREDDKIIVDCSNCSLISFVSNAAWVPDRIFRGENLTHAEYKTKDFEKWVRVEVCDENGNYAWSSIFEL